MIGMERSQKRIPRVGKIDNTNKTRKTEHKKIEFKKKLLIWAVLATSVCIIVSYILSACGVESNSDIATEMIRTCLGAIIGYCIATLGEKNSRNKYGIGEDGKPLHNTFADSSINDKDVEYEAETNGGIDE